LNIIINSTGGHSLKNYLILFVVVLGLSFTYGYFSVNSTVFFISMVGVLIVYLYVVLLPILFSNNIVKIEAFILKNQKKPFYYFLYTMANNLDDKVEDAMKKVMAKYKSPTRQAFFLTSYSLYKHDVEGAKANIEKIQPQKNRDYYRALICIEEGKLDEALSIADHVHSDWMKHTLRAEVYLMEGKQDQAKPYAKQAFDETNGLQKYSLYKNFEKLL
jgi:hypothetical protein